MPKKKHGKTFVYIIHPIAGDVENNIKKVLDICKEVHKGDIIPLVPYVTSVGYLDDNDSYERVKGTMVNRAVLQSGIIDEAWVYGDKISDGMKYDIEICCEEGIKLRVKNKGKSKEEHRNFIQEFMKVHNKIRHDIKIRKK